MDKITIITIIESIYIYYMYNIFKTRISIHHPFEILIQNISVNNYLKHSISSNIYESKICKFGKDASLIIILWLWIRLLYDKDKIKFLNKIIFITIFIVSLLMNINSFVYLLPIYAYELFVY